MLEAGPIGFAAILLFALVWLFRFYEKKLESMRRENRAMLVRAVEVVAQNNALLARVVPILERGEG